MVEVFEKLEQGLMREWRMSKHDDIETRERCHQILAGMDLFQQAMRSIMDSGKLAIDALMDRVQQEEDQRRARENTDG